jgi:hypothetical protein
VLKHLLFIFVTSVVLVAYQNCAPQKRLERPSSNKAAAAAEIVVATTAEVSKVTYDPELENTAPSATALLSVDLSSGQASLRGSDNIVRSCAIDQARLQSLASILAAGKVCVPQQDPDAVHCMALSTADVKLEESDSDSTMLRRVICQNGQYLCDGQDETFRSLLQSLVAQPPAGCSQ